MDKVKKLFPITTQITAKEKRYLPIKHYVFIVEVKWSDNSRIPIYRRYGDFANLHNDISDYVSSLEGRDIKLPQFPANKSFQRNEIRKNATVRRHALDDYCNTLLDMNTDISQNQILIDFFKCRPEDIKPLEKEDQNRKRSSLLQTISGLFDGKNSSKKGKNLEEEAEVDMDISAPIVCESYVVVADYTPEEKREIKLTEGTTVEVVEKYDNGWWFIQTDYGFGWAPATYLTPADPSSAADPEPLATSTKYMTIEAFKAEQEDEVSFNSGVLVKVLHKLLDGWWIIDYQGEVGYAPATFLQEYSNPHYKGTIKIKGTMKRLKYTKRRSTIKNSKGKVLPERKQRDMTLYRKYSRKIDQEEARRAALLKQARLSKGDGVIKSTYLSTNGVQLRKPSPTRAIINETVKEETDKETQALQAPDKLNDANNKHTESNENSCDEYDYIEENDMEEINNWVQSDNSKIHQSTMSVDSSSSNLSTADSNSMSIENRVSPRLDRRSPGLHVDTNLSEKVPDDCRRGSDTIGQHTATFLEAKQEGDFRQRSSSDAKVIKDRLKLDVHQNVSTSRDSSPNRTYNKAPPSPRAFRKDNPLGSTGSVSSAGSGMAFVYPPAASQDAKMLRLSQPDIVIQDTTQDSNFSTESSQKQDRPSESEVFFNSDNGVNYDNNQESYGSQTELTNLSRSSSPGFNSLSVSANENTAIYSKIKKSSSFNNRIYKKESNPYCEANNNNNGVTVADVMTMLVGALQSKAISGMRTNSLGELVITFDQPKQEKANNEVELPASDV